MNARTSLSHPIRVDFIPVEQAEGRLGMTFAPGKQHEGVTGGWNRDLDTDLVRLRDEFGVHLLVNLLEPHELEELGITGLPGRCRHHGITHWQFPIPDGGVPADLHAAVGLVQGIVERVKKGDTVVVHRKGGLGRTGTLTAACSVSFGHSPTEVIAAVRQARPGAIENRAQERCVAAITNLMDHEPPVG